MAKVRMHSPPARHVKKPNQRWARQRPITRGGASDHDGGVGGSPATVATAGIPGSWNGTAPASVADLQGGIPNVVTASPATAWTAGQYVQTLTADAAGRATWSGSGWVGGVAPGTTVGENPGAFTVTQVQEWVDDNPDLADEVLALETHDRQRVTLIDWLMGFIAHRDEEANAVQ